MSQVGLSVTLADSPTTPKAPEQKANFVEVVFLHYVFERSEEKTLHHIATKILPKIDLTWRMPEGATRTFTAQNLPTLKDIQEITSKISTTYHEDYTTALAQARDELSKIPLTERSQRIYSLSKEVMRLEENIEALQKKVQKAIPKESRTTPQARAYEADVRTLNQQIGLKRDYISMLEKIMGPLEQDVPLDITHDNVHDVALALIGSVEKWVDANLLPPILVDNAKELLAQWQATAAANQR